MGQPLAEGDADFGVEVRLSEGAEAAVAREAAQDEFEAQLRAAEFAADEDEIAGFGAGAS